MTMQEQAMDDWKTLQVAQTEEHIVTVTLSRPERRNAISLAMAEELEVCFTTLAARPGLRVVVLTGAGSAFCAGADLKERAGLDPDTTRRQRAIGLRVVELMESLHAPVIGMINGPAFAGGFELALACDMRIASDQAVFALTEVRAVGSFPGLGGPVRLPKLVGRGRANYLVLSGRRIGADLAFQFGLVEMVVPHAQLAAETLALAAEVAANSPSGVSAAKRLMRRANDLDVHAATELSRALRDPLDAGRDSVEGLNAWLTDQAPGFQDYKP
jgi:enoyl-CoA hydratase